MENTRDRSEAVNTHPIITREGKKPDFPECCSYGLISPENPFKWQGVIFGPHGTPYEDGVFNLSIDLPSDYPFKPPKIKFKTKVFHPNIDEDGTMYVDILEEDQWTSIQTIESVLLSIFSLLADPDPVDPLNNSCFPYRNDREEYSKTAREWTRKYAMDFYTF